MEMRKEPRFAADEPAIVTVLTPFPVELRGRIAEASEGGLRLVLDRPLQQGATLKLEFGDALLLAEVVWSRPVGQQYQIGITVEHALNHTRELTQLARRLLGENLRPSGRGLLKPQDADAVVERNCQNRQQTDPQ
jgi:hypothetical protein